MRLKWVGDIGEISWDEIGEMGKRLEEPKQSDFRGEDFSSLLRVQTGPEVHSASYKMSTGGFPRG